MNAREIIKFDMRKQRVLEFRSHLLGSYLQQKAKIDWTMFDDNASRRTPSSCTHIAYNGGWLPEEHMPSQQGAVPQH